MGRLPCDLVKPLKIVGALAMLPPYGKGRPHFEPAKVSVPIDCKKSLECDFFQPVRVNPSSHPTCNPDRVVLRDIAGGVSFLSLLYFLFFVLSSQPLYDCAVFRPTLTYTRNP